MKNSKTLPEFSAHPSSRRTEIVTQELADELLIYDLKQDRVVCLNKISKFIWLECDGEQTVSEIAFKVGKKLKAEVSEEIVWLAVGNFKKESLLENAAEINTPFDGQNRRQVIKRIGFAAACALPIVTGVVAPPASSAQSGCQTIVCGANCCPPNTGCFTPTNTCCPPFSNTPAYCNSIPRGCPCTLNCSGCIGTVCNTITGFCV